MFSFDFSLQKNYKNLSIKTYFAYLNILASKNQIRRNA